MATNRKPRRRCTEYQKVLRRELKELLAIYPPTGALPYSYYESGSSNLRSVGDVRVYFRSSLMEGSFATERRQRVLAWVSQHQLIVEEKPTQDGRYRGLFLYIPPVPRSDVLTAAIRSWNESTVNRLLATAIGDPSVLPVLADALQDAGYKDALTLQNIRANKQYSLFWLLPPRQFLKHLRARNK